MSNRNTLLLLAMLVPVAHAGNWNVPMEARNLSSPLPKSAVTDNRAARVYAAHCQRCHGAVGAGDGSEQHVGYDLRNIVVKLTDGELYWKITHGVGRMPSFAGPLTDEERWLAINHLRNLAAQPVGTIDAGVPRGSK
jgi:mono/diheme cytochrome c family protein